MTEPIPLVLVQGFLGTGGLISWDQHIASFLDVSWQRRKIIIPSLGPVSSLYDRACELYYCLVGGTVDYGEDHSVTHGHSRYGRTFSKGHYPIWSRERPLHFIGHSVGGPTIIKLQHLLEQGLFGSKCHPDMILSVNAVCSPFRGTQLVYSLGESLTAAPKVRPFSLGALLGRLVHILAYFSPLLPPTFDVHADSRSLSYQESSLVSFLRQLWQSQWAQSKDAVPYDMTFEAAEIRDTHLEACIYPNTFYRSHVSVMTRRANLTAKYEHHPRITFSLSHAILYVSSRLIGTFDYGLLHPSPSFIPHDTQQNTKEEQKSLPVAEVLGEEHLANDGVVPVFSQWHPNSCKETTCSHSAPLSTNSFEMLYSVDILPVLPVRGKWIVRTVKETNHLDFMPGLGNKEYQKGFWIEMYKWLHCVDTAR